MAAQLALGQTRLVGYLPGLRATIRHFRTFCSYDERNPKDPEWKENTSLQTEWPDTRLGPLEPGDRRFPMPGLTGPSHHLQRPVQLPAPTEEVADVLTGELPEDRHAFVLQQFLNSPQEEIEGLDVTMDSIPPTVTDVLECQAQQCPQLLRKDFQDLFPDHDLRKGPLTVITMSQKTENDMSGWSHGVEEERETLMDHFVHGAHDICLALHQAGYWADFIDPSSGRPYLGAYTNATLFETDERYRNFGFEIDDLGCCKVISHHLWGTHSFVGCLFTNAPLHHPVLQELTKLLPTPE